MYIVLVLHAGKGRYRGGDYIDMVKFRDYKKARNHYIDMLVKYPDCEVKIEVE